MLRYNTLDPSTLALLKEIQRLSGFQRTRLVGGTALALQLGHRKSVDLDFFGEILLSPEEIKEALSDNHRVTILKESRNINVYLVDGVKVDFVNYGYAWIDAPVQEDGITLAGLEDIAAMKIAAIVGRGTKKDFIDLYYLLEHFSLKEMLAMYTQKYPDGSEFIALKSLSYFDDAEADPMPYMFARTDWDSVKGVIREALAKRLQD